MTRESLELNTRKALAGMARQKGVDGWHTMRKDQLVDALIKASAGKFRISKLRAKGRGHATSSKRRSAVELVPEPQSRAKGSREHRSCENDLPLLEMKRSVARSTPKPPPGSGRNGHVAANPSAGKTKQPLRRVLERETSGRRDLAAAEQPEARQTPLKERLVAMVRDPFWLHVYWEIGRATIRRAEAALRSDWYRAVPILRLLEISDDECKSGREMWVRDIEIQAGAKHWYVPVDGKHRSYRLQIGYRVPTGKFFVLAKSNVVTTPRPGALGAIDENWNDVERHYEQILALSEAAGEQTGKSQLRELFDDHLQGPKRSPLARLVEANGHSASQSLDFQLQADLIIRGTVRPGAQLTIQGDPVTLREDGSFMLKMSLQDGRQLIPAVAVSADGLHQRTILLSIERNTKELQQQAHDEC